LHAPGAVHLLIDTLQLSQSFYKVLSKARRLTILLMNLQSVMFPDSECTTLP
jgi:hypothetical protein